MLEASTAIQPEAVKPSELEAVEGLLGLRPEKATAAPAGDGNDGAAEQEQGGESPEDDAPAEKLDYKLLVPIQGGEPVTLGALKDFYQGQQAAKAELIDRETATMRKAEELELLLSYVEELPPEVKERARGRAIADYERESRLLTATIPALKTPEGQKQVKDAIFALTDEYGIPRSVVQGIKDHITVKVLYDFARLKEGIKAARGNVKPIRADAPKAVAESKGPKPSELDTRIATAKRTRNSRDELAAVNALLGVK